MGIVTLQRGLSLYLGAALPGSKAINTQQAAASLNGLAILPQTLRGNELRVHPLPERKNWGKGKYEQVGGSVSQGATLPHSE